MFSFLFVELPFEIVGLEGYESKSIISCPNHDRWIIIKGFILSWVAGASEEGPAGARRSEYLITYFIE